jgi:hypothetical protein
LPGSVASAVGPFSALSRRWKALSTAWPREADGTQVKPKRAIHEADIGDLFETVEVAKSDKDGKAM